MKIASLIARYLLGLLFVVFGLNGFLHFIPMAMPDGTAGQFLGAIFVSRFYVVLYVLEVVPAIMLLVGRYVPLALVLLGPVIVNIFLYHAFMQPSGLPLAIIVVVLWVLVAAGVRSAFRGILQARQTQS